VIHEADKGHHPHGLADPRPVVDFVIEHAGPDRGQGKASPAAKRLSPDDHAPSGGS